MKKRADRNSLITDKAPDEFRVEITRHQEASVGGKMIRFMQSVQTVDRKRHVEQASEKQTLTDG